jgi:hypothetical protein
MKTKHLAFHLVFATIITAASLAPWKFIVGDGIVLSRSEFWRMGFGPASVGSALLLAVASFAAYRGSQWGAQLCRLWLGLFGIAYTALLICHFSRGWSRSLVVLVFAAVLWYWMTPSRRTEDVA